MTDTFALIAIFIAMPLAIAFFGVRNYRNVARREAEEAAEAEAAARKAAKAEAQTGKLTPTSIDNIMADIKQAQSEAAKAETESKAA